MAIRQRGDSWEASVSYEGQRYRKSLPTRASAAEWQETKLYELRNGIKQHPKLPLAKWNLKKAIDMTFQMVWGGKRSEKENMYKCNQIMKYFGASIPICDITTEMIDEWIIDMRRQGNSNRTINCKMAGLRKVLRFAHQRGKVTTLPFFTEQDASGSKRIRWLTSEEESRVSEFVSGDEDMYDMFIVLLDTGMRLGEFERIQKRDINNGMINIWETKADLPRSIPMTLRVDQIIEKRQARESEYLFPQKRHYYRHRWELMRKELNLPDVVIHVLRHTFASKLVQRGANILSVQKLLGHRDIQNTMIYAHLAPHNLSECIHLLRD